MKILKFSIGNESFGIQVNKIDEIAEKESITNIPNSKPEIEGVMDLRGDVTSIINPRILFDLDKDISEDNYIIVLGSKGVVVTEVHDIFEIKNNDLNEVITEENSNVLGITEHHDEFITVVNHKIAK